MDALPEASSSREQDTDAPERAGREAYMLCDSLAPNDQMNEAR